jgi:release factor glutamine methyltransferase
VSEQTVRSLLVEGIGALNDRNDSVVARFIEPASATREHAKAGHDESRPCDAAEIRREAELLLQHALGVDRAWLFAHADDIVSDAPAGQFRRHLSRRVKGEPIAYITGRREFFSIDLAVTPDVLVPRPETELLVELALEKIPQGEKVYVADLGTGSGAIALAIASECPQASVLATDASLGALGVARGNARRLELTNVEFALGDWCAPLRDRVFDVIASNPPYIAAGDPHLDRGDLRFEPALALSSGADGLDAIRTIARDARSHLKPGGWLFFEHGYDQGEVVRAILEAGGYADAVTVQDLEGRDRVSFARHVGVIA